MWIIEILLIIFGVVLALVLLTMLILFIMLLPGKKTKELKDFKWLLERPIAHR